MSRQSSIVVVLALAASAALFAGSYLVSQRFCAKQMASSTDDLDWLRQEFHLSEADMAQIRLLHEGYTPKCAEMCKQIAAKKRELESTLSVTTNFADIRWPAGRQLGELGLLRAQCQTQMLQHFHAVSQAMPPKQGRRYLAEMQRVTLGFHEQIEQSMSNSADHEHGHH